MLFFFFIHAGELCLVFLSKAVCSIFVIVDSGDVCTDQRGILNMFLCTYIAPLNFQNSR